MTDKRYCSIPDIFGLRQWFEKHFKDVCIEHDYHYLEKDVSMLTADFKAILGLFKIKWWVGGLAGLLYPLWLPLAAYYWYFKN